MELIPGRSLSSLSLRVNIKTPLPPKSNEHKFCQSNIDVKWQKERKKIFRLDFSVYIHAFKGWLMSGRTCNLSVFGPCHSNSRITEQKDSDNSLSCSWGLRSVLGRKWEQSVTILSQPPTSFGSGTSQPGGSIHTEHHFHELAQFPPTFFPVCITLCSFTFSLRRCSSAHSCCCLRFFRFSVLVEFPILISY